MDPHTSTVHSTEMGWPDTTPGHRQALQSSLAGSGHCPVLSLCRAGTYALTQHPQPRAILLHLAMRTSQALAQSTAREGGLGDMSTGAAAAVPRCWGGATHAQDKGIHPLPSDDHRGSRARPCPPERRRPCPGPSPIAVPTPTSHYHPHRVLGCPPLPFPASCCEHEQAPDDPGEKSRPQGPLLPSQCVPAGPTCSALHSAAPCQLAQSRCHTL